MTRDDIIRMAREAGGADITVNGFTSWVGTQSPEFLERFAALVAADREHRDRRERIATAALQGLLAHYGENSRYDNTESREVAAVAYADALIAELDKPKEGGA